MSTIDVMKKLPEGVEFRNSAEVIHASLDPKAEVPGFESLSPASALHFREMKEGKVERSVHRRAWLPFPCDCGRVSELPIQERHIAQNWKDRFDFVCADCRAQPVKIDEKTLSDDAELSRKLGLVHGIIPSS